MKRLLVLTTTLCIGFTLYGAPSSATTIAPDPLIGVRGGGGGSPSVTDTSFFDLDVCAGPTLAGFFCAPFQNDQTFQIFSLDVSFRDANGDLIPTTVGGVPNFSVSSLSDFQGLTIVDEFTVRLFFCPTCEDTDPPIGPGTHLRLFSNVDGSAAVEGVNVPEPATLLLVGTGVLAAFRRVRSRRNRV